MSEITMFTDRFVKLERWSESEKRHIIKNSSIVVQNVKANIERNDNGYFLRYKSPNLNAIDVRSSPIIAVEHQKENTCYVISTMAYSDTVYYKLTY